MDTGAVVCYTVEYYSAVKKDVIPPLVTTWMDPDSIVLSETGQTKDKKPTVSFTRGIQNK